MSECLGYKSGIKARKPHRCYWCGEAINPGDTYVRWAWAGDDGVTTIHCHPECEAAWATLGWDQNEVGFAEYSRGCTCENGRCECAGVAVKGDTT